MTQSRAPLNPCTVTMSTLQMNDDLQLVKAYLAGSDEAIEELVIRYQKPVYYFIFRMIHDAEEAKDLTQKTFLNVATSLKNFRGDSSFRTWLYQIATNASLNHIKKRKHTEVEAEDSLPGNGAGPLSRMVDREQRDLVRQAITRLPERQRLALILRVYNGLSCLETAQAMGCSEGAVKAHYHHAVKNLKGMLKESGHEVTS